MTPDSRWTRPRPSTHLALRSAPPPRCGEFSGWLHPAPCGHRGRRTDGEADVSEQPFAPCSLHPSSPSPSPCQHLPGSSPLGGVWCKQGMCRGRMGRGCGRVWSRSTAAPLSSPSSCCPLPGHGKARVRYRLLHRLLS